ncbi:MAG: hypothetical protein AB9846_14935 [Tenuifilaceae bacterium]
MEDIVFVKGNIIFKSGDHQVKELVAYANDEWEKIAEEIKIGDLIVTHNDILMPYKVYCASAEISTYGNFISGMQRPNEVVRIYKDEIINLQKLKSLEVNNDLLDVLNRQIYIGVVGTMELFLCDFLYSMVLGTREYYYKFCENCSRSFKLKEISTKQWKIQDGVIKTILETNYHKIDEIKMIYKKTLDIEFPSIEKLEKQILTRHRLVHRNGFPSSKPEYIKVNHKMIDELIIEVQTIVNHIIITKQDEIDNWFPDPTKN